MPSPTELLADVKSLVSDVEKDVESFAGDVEGHLRVCVAHLRSLVGGKSQPTAQAEQAPTEEPVADSSIPPKGGPGSGAPAWREYAAESGVEVDEEASRDEVIEALTAAGVSTEAEG